MAEPQHQRELHVPTSPKVGAAAVALSTVVGKPPSPTDTGTNVLCRGRLRYGIFWIKFAVRRRRLGLVISFPCRSGHPLAWPIDRTARRAVEDYVLDALREQGWVR